MRRILPLVVALIVGGSLAAPAGSLPRGLKVQTYKGDLNFPIDMAWVKGTKKIFFTEKTGRVRVLVGRRLLKRACVKLDVNSAGERGGLGIALHPKYKSNHYLYVFYTNASPLEHRVTRFKVVRNRCRRAKRVVGGLRASSSGYHNGGQIEFAGGKLFVTTGDAHNSALAQNRGSRLGKVLRYNPNGSIPKGNPFSRPGNRNPVWTYGHRNPFGLTRRPGRKTLYETENGPNCDDELNIVRKGRNYGWGSGYDCGTAGIGPKPKRPLRRWSQIIVPTDPLWYRGSLGRLNGDLFVGAFGNNTLHRIKLNRKGTRVRSDRIFYTAGNGIVDVALGPKRRLYFLTPGAILRVVRK